MVKINPADYINRVTSNDVPNEVENNAETNDLNGNDPFIKNVELPQSDTVLTGQGGMLLDASQMQDGATTYAGYENDALNYSRNLFKDDTAESIITFLERMRLTAPVCKKFAEVYLIAASQDNVLTWSNAWLLQRRANMFKLQMLEFKNTLLGPDADSLLFGDFDLVIEILTARLEARNGRSFEGFERKAGVTNYTYSHNFDGNSMEMTKRDDRSGLSKLVVNLSSLQSSLLLR